MELIDLLYEDELDAPEALPLAEGQRIPVGYQTRIFLERGANIGEQRNEAVRATRNLLGAGYSVDQVAEKIWSALQKSTWDPDDPWTFDEVHAIAVDLASKPAPPPPPFERGEIIIDTAPSVKVVHLSVSDEGLFSFAYPDHDVEIEISRVVATAKVTTAWIRASIKGEEVGAVECELRTSQGVRQMWGFFEKWGELPWAAMLEHARREVLRMRRTGGVPVEMAEVVVPSRPRLRINPLIVNGHLNVVFAAGGSGKSLLMCLWALMVQGGVMHAGMTVTPGNVLYLDWEQGAEDAKATLDALAQGMGLEHANYTYMRCMGTLVEVAEEVGRLIAARDIDVVMLDSLTFALGGDKNDAQSVLAGLAALRQWPEGVTVIALDHVTKAERGRSGGTPIGSIFVENQARNLLRIMAWMDAEEHVLHQVIQQTKQNKGALPDFGLSYTFEPESMAPTAIYVEREDPPFDVEGAIKEREQAAKRESRPASSRAQVLEFIKQHPDRFWSRSAIAKELGANPETVKSAIAWLVKQGELTERTHGSGKQPSTYGTVGHG